MTARALELDAEEGLADRDGGVLRFAAVLNEIEWRSVVDAAPLRFEQQPDQLVDRRVLIELGTQPAAEVRAFASVVAGRVASEEDLIPDVSLIPRVAGVFEQPVDQSRSLLGALVGEERVRRRDEPAARRESARTVSGFWAHSGPRIR